MSDESGALGIIVEEDVPVPMRDGTILRANVFRPDAPGKFPALLIRTPYGKAEAGYDRYVRAGYVVAAQDTRGRYASEGEYIMCSVENTGDAEDGYDTVEWLADQPYCDGNIGTFGASYTAWMQWQLAKLRPPHLKAMSAQTVPTELTMINWPGSFRVARRLHWWLVTIAPDLRRREGLSPPHTPDQARPIWNEIEQGRWLGFMPWIELPRYMPKQLARYVEDWLKHPNCRPWKLDEAWKEIEVPNLDFSGYYDHCSDTMRHLPGMQNNARTEVARKQTKLIIGPWNHGGFGNRKLGDIDFGPQAELDKMGFMMRWFDHWLKGLDNGVDREPPVRYLVMGSGKWKSASTWPPEGMSEATYYLSSNGKASPVDVSGTLTPEAPGDEPPDQYTYDPKDPVPTLWDRQLFTVSSDRRKLHYRRDILYYRTPPLEQQVEIVGYPQVVLYASSSAPDTDFFARLVDEDPDGPALEVSYGMVRARHRNSLDEEEFITPGEVAQFSIELGPTACCFQKGHRIRLEITSSDFPNYDRNHNTGRNDLEETELVPAEQKVFHTAQYASRLVVCTDNAP